MLNATFIDHPEAYATNNDYDPSKTISNQPNEETAKSYSQWFDKRMFTVTENPEEQNAADGSRPNQSRSLRDPTLGYSKWFAEKSPHSQSSKKDLRSEGARTATDAYKLNTISVPTSPAKMDTNDGLRSATLYSKTTGYSATNSTVLQDQKTDQTTETTKEDDKGRPCYCGTSVKNRLCHCCSCCHQAQMVSCFNSGDSRPSSPISGAVPIINHTVTYTLCHSDASSTCGSYREK